MSMRRKLLVGNWKMNGDLARNAALLAVLRAAIGARSGDGGRDPGGGIGVDIAVCAPAPYLAQCQAELADSAIRWGAQDVSVHCVGAYTGEVSAAMLREFGCSFVIVGHSERRAYHGEGNGLVAKKAVQALQAGLTPIVCVGETLSERETGLTGIVVGGQVEALVSVLDAEALSRVVIAYEPVWAIGTGVTATPDMAQEMHAQIRMRLAARHADAAKETRILYGGSMKPDNAADLLAMPDIDGGLIGGASLTAADFLAIVGQAHAGEGNGAGSQASD
jgi:triosephosphate isomerase